MALTQVVLEQRHCTSEATITLCKAAWLPDSISRVGVPSLVAWLGCLQLAAF